jgi:ribonuclease P protein component
MNDEAHFSAEQSGSEAPSRLPRPHGDPRRSQHHSRASCPRPQEPERLSDADQSASLAVMARRADFLAANRGMRAPMPGFVLLVRDRRDGCCAKRFGITVTKKIGGAVVRNRMKRRFRVLARELLPNMGLPGADHVLIGRASGIERDFAQLRAELEKALRKVARGDSSPAPQRGPKSARSGGNKPKAPALADHGPNQKAPRG